MKLEIYTAFITVCMFIMSMAILYYVVLTTKIMLAREKRLMDNMKIGKEHLETFKNFIKKSNENIPTVVMGSPIPDDKEMCPICKQNNEVDPECATCGGNLWIDK